MDFKWPTEFRAQYGRAPRVLHIGNIANYAWTNAKLMSLHGVECTVIDPDSYHINSAPEWIEADLSSSVGDPFYPQWEKAGIKDFKRPEWFISGPTPFAWRELAARQNGHRLKRYFFSTLSRLYQRFMGSPTSEPSRFRAMMESHSGSAMRAKAFVKRLTLGRAVMPTTLSSPVLDTSALSDVPSQAIVTEQALPASLSPELVKNAMSAFDIVIGYALGARFPAAIGFERYASLEIGTLRGLVFEASARGQLAAQIYRQSPFVIVTNVDCMEAADRLGLKDDNLIPIPHPFDLKAATTEQTEKRPVADPDALPYFLCPARHHWKSGNSSWLKGNDILIRGAALAVQKGAEFRLVFSDWGEEVAESKALIEELGLSSRIAWKSPLPRHQLWQLMRGSVGVIDQFAASAFGGVALDSMALGVRLISRLDQSHLKPFFGSLPPILTAATPEQVAERILAVLQDPADQKQIGAKSVQWMQQEHGVAQQLDRQFQGFDKLIRRYGPAKI